MKIFLIFIVSAFLWCILFGYPYTLLLDSYLFWIAVMTVGLFLCATYAGPNQNNRIIAGFGCFGILLAMVYMIVLWFSKTVSDATLRMLGLQDYLEVFHENKISYWELLLCNILEALILNICGVGKANK